MDSKRYKTSIGIISGLAVLSVGLFGYQNLYYNKQVEKSKAIIFVAKTDIQAKTKITADMFEAHQVSSNAVLKTYVTDDISKYIGKELKGGLLVGEPLTNVRINEESKNLGENLVLKLEADFMSNVKANDNVRVYVMLTDKHSGEVTVKDLFTNKKVYGKAQAQNAGLVTINNAQTEMDKPELFIDVTDVELQAYYKAKTTGKIIVSKVTDLDLEKITSDKPASQEPAKQETTDKFDPNSKETQNSYRPTDNKDNSVAVMKYTVKEGDTIDTITQKFKTSKDALAKLNNDKNEFKAGDEIVVPAI